MATTVDGAGTGAGPAVAVSLDVAWAHGTRPWRQGGEPPIQVHWCDEDTVIMRQSKTLNYEAPFMYLLFGAERALLLDTGATQDPALFPLRKTVDALVEEWLARRTPRADREDYALVVAHSHGHGDHVAADAQFADRPRTTVVGVDAAAVRAFFGFGGDWTRDSVRFDLGGRVLEILGSPGHHESAVTIHDPRTGVLLTGDTLLPGRLFAFDADAYAATLDRLVAFTRTRTVTYLLGGHIEMKRGRGGRDYPIGAEHQPRERPLEMTPAQLVAVRDAVAAVARRPGVHRFPDAVLYNAPGRGDLRRLLLRGRTHKVLRSSARWLSIRPIVRRLSRKR